MDSLSSILVDDDLTQTIMNLSLLECLATGVSAACVTALVTVRLVVRRAHTDNITKERTKWRGRLREVADELAHAVETVDRFRIRRSAHTLKLLLNLFELEDEQIVSTVVRLADCSLDKRHEVLNEVTTRLALLLQHDWEQCKHERQLWAPPWAAPQAGLLRTSVKDIITERRQTEAVVMAFGLRLEYAAPLCGSNAVLSIGRDARRLQESYRVLQ